MSVAGYGFLVCCEIDTCCVKRERRGMVGDVDLLSGWLGKELWMGATRAVFLPLYVCSSLCL